MENTTAPIPVVNEDKKTSVGLVILFSFLFLIIGIAVGYYMAAYKPISLFEPNQPNILPSITPTPSTSQDTETFKDELGRYQIQIPKDWKYIEHSSNFQDTNQFQAPDGSSLQISILDSNVTGLSVYLAKQDEVNKTSWEGQPGRKVISTKKTTLLGLPAVERVEEWSAAGFQVVSTYFLVNNTVYQFTVQPGSEGDYRKTETLLAYRSILDSFEPLSTP